MKPESTIKIFRDEHHFAAAHFLIDMGKCERLHGHNYFLTVELGGQPGPNGALVDFNEINPMIAELCKTFDHKMLIAKKDDRHSITIDEDEIEVTFKSKRFVFPKEDCILVPVQATTVERLSEYFCEKLASRVAPSHPNVKWIEVGVREGSAQMAAYRISLK